MTTTTRRFVSEKVTKNTVRFQEVAEGPIVIGPVYIQKSALGTPMARVVELTITSVE